MKLDRNAEGVRRNKYGLVKRRRIDQIRAGGEYTRAQVAAMERALELLVTMEVIDWADTPETECFVVRLKDIYAADALNAYADSARFSRHRDLEYSGEVRALAARSGPDHPNCKVPD